MTVKRVALVVFVALACLAALPTLAHAQSAIAGTVRDSSGGVLPGVTVEAASDVLIEKVRTVVTDGAGLYNIIDLRPGTYTVTFTLSGFQTFKREQLELPGGFTATIDATMRVGSLEESVTVAGASPVVDVQSNTKAAVLPRDVLDSVPNAHTIQSVGQLIPGVTLTSPDVGGSAQMQQTYFSVHGFGAAGTTLLMDGMIVNTLGSDGAIQNYLTTAGNQEMVYQTGGGGGDSLTGGLNINMVPREGGNRFAVTSSLGLERWQSNNFTQALKDQGVTQTDQLGDYHDFDLSVGGPVKKDRIWFFLVGRLSKENKPVANTTNSELFAANPMTLATLTNPDASSTALAACRAEKAAAALANRESACPVGYSPEIINSALGRVTVQIMPKLKLQMAYDKIDKERISAQAALDDQRVTGIHWTSPNYSTQTAKLTATVTNRLLLEGGWSAAIERYNTYYQDGLVQRYYTPLWYTLAARNNTTETQYSVAPSNNGRTYPDRYNFQGSASYVTGTHNFKVGFLDSFGTYNRGSYKNGDIITNFQTQGGVPNTAYQAVIYPTDPRDQQRLNAMVSIYAQDSWTHKRVTLTGGLRYDYDNQEVLGSPAQQGTFEVIPAYGNIAMPIQKNWSPRISGVVDVFGNGKTALRAGFNKIVNSATESLATGQNPGSGNSATVNWNDVNHDNVAQYQVSPQPLGGVISNCTYGTAGCELDFSKLPANFGAVRINNTLDPNLGRPFAYQINVGVSQEVMSGVSVSVEWFRTDNKNINATRNTARVVNGLADLSKNPNYQPFTVYSPIDGHAVTMYDLASAAVSTAAVTNFTYVDPSLTSLYNGVDVGFNARLPHGGRIFGGATRERTISNACSSAVDNPNILLYCDGANLGQGYEIPWKTQYKLAATYPLPWFGISVNGSYQGLPGYTEGNTTMTVGKTTKYVNCPGTSAANGCAVGGFINANIVQSGSFSVPLDPSNVTLTPRTNQVDFGLSKRIKIGRLRFDPKIDLFNALNSNDFYSVRSTTFSPILDPSAADPAHAPALPSLASGTNYTNFRAPGRFLQGRLVRLGFNLAW